MLTCGGEHPAYRAGHAAHDLGLRMALDIICAEWARSVDAGVAAAITAERAHQERLARHPDSGSACRVYANGVLLAVAKVMARRFRQ